MSHVVHLVFKDKTFLPLQPVVVSEAYSKVWLNHHITTAQSHFLFHFTHEELITTFDVSGIEKYVLLFFQKEASGIQFKEAVFYYTAQSPTLVETSYKLALVLPLTALQSVEGLQSLYVKYSNDTLSWPTAIAGKYAFKIPEKQKQSYVYNA